MMGNQDTLDYAESILATVREPMLVLDRDLRVITANRSFYRVFQVEEEETENRLVYELGNGQWDIAELRTLLEDILPQNHHFDDFKIEHDFPAIGRKVMLLNARAPLPPAVRDGSRRDTHSSRQHRSDNRRQPLH